MQELFFVSEHFIFLANLDGKVCGFNRDYKTHTNLGGFTQMLVKEELVDPGISFVHAHPCTQLRVYHSISLTVNPTPMKMHIIPIVIYAQQRLRGSALPTEELLEKKWYFKLTNKKPHNKKALYINSNCSV